MERLDMLIRDMHGVLFPEGFSIVDKDELVSQIVTLTTAVNEALRWYHDLDPDIDEEKRHAASPVLTYTQDLLKRLCRCAVFDQPQLTKFNQILVDTATMLLDRETLLAGIYTEQAEYQRRIVKDEALKRLMETFLGSFTPVDE